MYAFLFLAAVSLILCLILTPLCRKLFVYAGWLDHPDQARKFHVHAIPRAGGIPIAIAYVGSFILLLLSPLHAGSMLEQHLIEISRLLPAVALIFATGLLDDLMGLDAWQKLLGQIAAALAAYSGGVQVLGVSGFQIESWWTLPLTVAWLVGCSNAFNLIDGIDGLAAGLGLFATLTILTGALLQGNLALALATAPLAGALLGFLRYNFNPASIFLGDSGSLLVGFLLGCYGVVWSQKSATLLAMTAPLMAMAVPILDVCLSIARRFLRRQPIFGADRGHIHHRLLDRGLSPRKVALLLYAAGGLAALFSIAQSLVHSRLSAVVLASFIACAWIFVGRLEYVEFSVAGKVLSGGAVRRLVGAHIHLRNLDASLAGAGTPYDCWIALRETGRLLGFRQISVHLRGETYREQFRPAKELGCWSLRIPLSTEDYVSCDTEAERGYETAGTEAFAYLIGNQLRAKLPALRATGSLDSQIVALIEHAERPVVKNDAQPGTPVLTVPILTLIDPKRILR